MRFVPRFFLLIFVFMLSMSLTFCAASREDEENSYDTNRTEQNDLEDIEKLLGITGEEGDSATKTAQPAAKEKDQLNLLDTNESATNRALSGQGALSQRERDKYERKIKDLEQQIREKDAKIVRLQEQLSESQASVSSRTSSVSYGTLGTVSDSEYESRYNEARSQFEARNYETAIQLFESLLASSSTNKLSDNAQYWIGECHYALKRYDEAIIDFEKVLTFPNSNKKADAQYKLGLCYLRKGDNQKAAEELNRLREMYPNSSYSARAAELLSKL